MTIIIAQWNGCIIQIDAIMKWEVNCNCYHPMASTIFICLNSCCTFSYSLPVPTPSVTIIAPSGPLYVGDSLTLQCQVEISDAVDTPVDVSYTWKKSGAAITGDSNTLNSMSVTTSTGGSYSCEAMVTPRGSTEFMLPSSVGMDITDVVVQGNAAHGMIM